MGQDNAVVANEALAEHSNGESLEEVVVEVEESHYVQVEELRLAVLPNYYPWEVVEAVEYPIFRSVPETAGTV